MKIDIRGDGYEIDNAVRSYVDKKIGKLAKKLSKHQLEAAHVIVALKQRDGDPSHKFQAEIIFRLPPKEELVAKEAAINMFPAIDIAEAKIANQLRKYKSKHDSNKIDRKGTLQRLRRLADRDYWGSQN